MIRLRLKDFTNISSSLNIGSTLSVGGDLNVSGNTYSLKDGTRHPFGLNTKGLNVVEKQSLLL